MGAHQFGNNSECDATGAGRQAALDLATSRPEDFSKRCSLIDEQLSQRSPDSSKQFLTAMTTELEQRNLLPRVELNFISQSDSTNFGQLSSDRHRHIYTDGMQQTQDQLAGNGKLVESELVHGLINHQKDIESTHAERNFWGKNHGGIDMDRLQRWENNAKPDLTDLPLASRNSNNGSTNDKLWSQSPFSKQFNDAKDGFDQQIDKQTKETDKVLHPLAKERKAHQDQIDHIKHVQDGVIRDAHQTVQHGDTLYDMAVVSLVRTNKTHFTQTDVQHEIEKLRVLNHLAPHQELHSGQSLMLRTPQEVAHEVKRRLRLEEANQQHDEPRKTHAPYLVC